MSLRVLSLLLIVRRATATNQPCFLRCKDNYKFAFGTNLICQKLPRVSQQTINLFCRKLPNKDGTPNGLGSCVRMNGMQETMSESSAEWSLDMVTPLQSMLLADPGVKGGMERRIGNICSLNDIYMKCLNACENGPAKDILITGQRSWEMICDEFGADTEFRWVVLPCWADVGREMSDRCAEEAQQLHSEVLGLMEGGLHNMGTGLEALCKSSHDYDKCFVRQNYDRCGVNAGKFVIKLIHVTSHSLVELISSTSGSKDLPKTCKDWLNQKGLGPKAKQNRKERTSSANFLNVVLMLSSVATFFLVR